MPAFGSPLTVRTSYVGDPKRKARSGRIADNTRVGVGAIYIMIVCSCGSGEERRRNIWCFFVDTSCPSLVYHLNC
jgi:hypothetical protein